jgi:hypothetical protein
VESIKRRVSKSYRSFLFLYSSMLVLFCFVLVFTIIHLSLLFSPLNTVAAEVRNIAASGTGDMISKIQGVVSQLQIEKCTHDPALGAVVGVSSGVAADDAETAREKRALCESLNSQLYELDSSLSKIDESTSHNLDILAITTGRLRSEDSFVRSFLAFFSFDSSAYLEGKEAVASSSNVDITRFDHPIQKALSTLVKRNSTMEPIAQLIGAHILPLLYGMLGAAVYMLRNINGVPVGVLNLADSALECSLRIGLGGIAGLAIGWFNIGEEAGKLTTTPFAIAFIAGFSIDILFSLLERFINVFSGRPAQ